MIRDGQHIGTREAEGMSEDDIITMMVGRELTALYPNEPHTTGDEVLRVENLTAWHPVNRHIKRVNNISFSLHRGEISVLPGSSAPDVLKPCSACSASGRGAGKARFILMASR